MPTHDASRLVNPTATLIGESEWPDRVTDLTAVEVAPVARDGVVHFSVLVSWRYDSAVPVKGFRVYKREEGDPYWELGAEAVGGADNARVGGFYRSGASYEFAVVTIGLNCCAHEGPNTAPRVAITYHGLELLPEKPTGLTVTLREDALVVAWTPVSYPGEIQYEVRVGGGTNVETAVVVDRTRLSEVTLQDVAPVGVSGSTLVVSVIAVTGSGLRSSAAQATVSSLPGGLADDVDAADLSDGGAWTGTLSSLSVVGSDLEMDAGAVAAQFISAVQDAGSIAERQVLVLHEIAIENEALTWDTAAFTWDGYEAQRRTWDMGGLDVPAIPEVLDGRGGPTWDQVEETWDDLDWMTWDAFPELPEDAPLTWDEAGFTWDSDYAASLTWDGPYAHVAPTVVVYVRFSDDNLTWTAWTAYARQSTTFRYWQVRIDVTRPSDATSVTFTQLRGFLVRHGGVALDRSKSAGLLITQASHGFSVGDAIFHNGTTYGKARADAEATVGRFVVAEVPSSSTFVAVAVGFISGLSGLTAGTMYYVSEATGGLLSAVEPPSGNYSNPLLLAVSATEGWVLPLRPTLVP